METKEDVLKLLESEIGSSVAIRLTDNQGANERFDACQCGVVLNMLNVHSYEFNRVIHAPKYNGFDLKLWTQCLNEEDVTSLKISLYNDKLFVASFESETFGFLDIVIGIKCEYDRRYDFIDFLGK